MISAWFTASGSRRLKRVRQSAAFDLTLMLDAGDLSSATTSGSSRLYTLSVELLTACNASDCANSTVPVRSLRTRLMMMPITSSVSLTSSCAAT